MKKVLGSLTVLFAAALLIYSCNPEDEAQLPPPNNQTQVTVAEANNLIQGAWYIKRVETYITYCIGDDKMINSVFNTNPNFTSYKYEFNADNQVICQSGSFSLYFEILPFDFNETIALNLNMVEGDICLNIADCCAFLWTPAAEVEASYMKIIELTSNTLILESSAGRLYFEKDLSVNPPVNLQGLSGTYVHDLYSDIVNGVVEYSSVPYPVKLTFSDEIFSPYESYIGDFGQYFKGVADYSDCPFGSYYQIFDDMYSFSDPVESKDYFRYQASASHLFSYGSNALERFKIHVLNQNELVLRLHTSCNSYEEFHYTRVN